MHIFSLESLKVRDHAEDLGVNGKQFRMDLREIRWNVVE
jgi:hypothetical protein